MRRVRLRWRLAASHAVLAVLLVGFAASEVGAQSERADRNHATAIAEGDADVLAARSARMYSDPGLLSDVLTDEEQGTRRAEVVSIDRQLLVGSDLVGEAGGEAVARRVLRAGSPVAVVDDHGGVIAGSPVVVDSVVVAVALVAETVASRPSWSMFLGGSGWIGALVVLLAALAGWFLAGLWSRPISALTDSARSLVLGGSPMVEAAVERSSTRINPEVDTLAAAIRDIAGREQRRNDLADEHRESLRMLAHRLSHQLRTPLTVLRLRLDDLADPKLSEQQREVLDSVVGDQIDQLDRLGEQLAELDPARWALRPEPLDLEAVVTEVVERNVPLATWGGVGLAMDSPRRTGPSVPADDGLLREALANVVQNAIKYTPRGGRILVGVEHRAEDVVVIVSDTGPGIAPSERDHVLRSGGRGSAGARVPGTGHGLALVTDVAHRHGGHVELAETPGGGATVRIVLPISPRSG